MIQLRLIFFFVISLSLLSCIKEQPTRYYIGDNFSFLKITPNATMQELSLIKDEFYEKADIYIDYKGTIFNDHDRIERIQIKVSMPSGASGSTFSDPFDRSIGFTIRNNSLSVGSMEDFPASHRDDD